MTALGADFPSVALGRAIKWPAAGDGGAGVRCPCGLDEALAAGLLGRPVAPLPELFTGGMLGLVLLAAADGVCEGEFVGGSVLGGGLLGEVVVAVVAGVGVAEVGAGDGETLDDDGAGVGPVVAEVGVGVGRGARQPGAGDWPSGAAGDAETGPGVVGVPDALTAVAARG